MWSVGRVEVEEQLVDLVEHLVRSGVGAVDLVQHERRPGGAGASAFDST